MSIKETVDKYRFRDVLMSDEYASWSLGAVNALYDYYEQLSDEVGEDIELDRVAIRCEWVEYPNVAEVYDNYSEKENSNELTEEEMREWLEERTTVLNVENIDTSANEYRTINSILVMQF